MSGFVFSEKPITIERGEGASLYDDDGNEYLDFGASYACTPVGHCHPRVVEDVQQQVAELLYVQASYPQAARTELYGKLATLAPGDLDNVWLCNSGTEANEAAMKFARNATGDEKIVATTQAFHGRTMGALAMTWKKKYKAPFEPLAGGVEFVDYGDAEALAAAVDEDTAAVFLEPIQGEGGIHPAGAAYLETARELTEDAGAALVFDEIQTGVGRTGSLWACEAAGVVPDIITTAKGIASGLPLGATVVADWIADADPEHGSTFSGGPVVSTAANTTLDVVVEENLPEHAAEMGDYIVDELRARQDTDELPIREIRGEGLMIGIEVKRGANRLLRDLAIEHGVLALPAGRTVLRLLPPLIIEQAEADAVVDAIAEVLS